MDEDELVRVRILIPGRAPRMVSLGRGRHVFGRSQKVEVPLTDGSVSRRHLELDVDGKGSATVRDLGSSRGTFVNGQALSGARRVVTGDILGLGDQRIELADAPWAEATRLDRGEPEPDGTMREAFGGPSRGGGTVIDPTGHAPRVFRSAALEALGAPPTEEDLAAAERASVLADLSDEERQRVLQFAERVEVPPGTPLVRIGEVVDELIVVLSGEVRLIAGERSVGTVRQGGAIDLPAVILGSRAAATAITDETATVLRIDAGLLREVLALDPQAEAMVRRPLEWPGAERLRDLLLEYGVARPVQRELLSALRRRAVPAGARINEEGDRAVSLWIVDRGSLAGWKMLDGVPVMLLELSVGSLIGGAELIAERPLALRYVAATDVELLELDAATLLRLTALAPELRQLVEALGPFGRQAAETIVVPDEHPPDEDTEAPPIEAFLKGKSRPPPRRARRIFIRQHDEMDCGAACLAMIANAYGRRISLAYYRALVHVTRDGASMWSLVRAARRTGFEVIGVKSSAHAIRGVYLPALLLFQYHFVVLYAITKKYAWVADPAIGIRKLPIEEFKDAWSGMALFVKPTPALYRHVESAAGYAKYRVLLRGLLRPVFEILCASLLLFGFGLVTPLFTQVVFDRVLVRADRTLLNILMLAVAVVVLLQQATQGVRSYLTGYVANKFDATFSALVYRHVLRLPLNYFMVRRVGDILTRFREMVKIRQFFTGDTLTSLIQVASVAMYVGVLYLYHPRLGQAALLLVPVILATALLTGRRLERLLQEGFPARAKAQGLIVEQMRALDTIKSLGAELPSRWRWEEALRDSLRNRFRVDRLRVLTTTISGALEQMSTTGLTFYAAHLALRGQLSIGKVIATTQFVTSIFGPVRELAGRWTTLQDTKVALGRVDDIITASPEAPGARAEGSDAEPVAGDIEFEDVWFQYGSDLSPWVMKGVTIKIARGETVAIVGRSGSGKTTLVQLINLLYRPTRGRILIGGKDTSALPLTSLRGSVGIVMQDSTLFAGSIFENITFGQDPGSPDLAIAAARVANAHTFIAQLKSGYSTMIEEGGRGLSGGQRQRINIARALYRRPSILILDEATSALDSESERAVVDAMKVFCRGRTSIIIAHRLSTILHADRIVMLDNGRVVETGSHRELIRKGGAYAQLFGAQLAI